MNLRILLIRPYNKNIIHIPIPLGLLYIAGFLKQQGIEQIKIIDGRLERLSDYEFQKRIKEFGPNIIGISSLSVEKKQTHNLAKIIKDIDKNYKVVIGGPYATAEPDEILLDKNIDFIVKGEGELPFYNLLKRKSDGIF